MIEDVFVLDGVIHAYNFAQSNWKDPDACRLFAERGYHGIMKGLSPWGEPQWLMDHDLYFSGRAFTAESMAHAMFAESWTDAVVYHAVPKFGKFHDGGSPLEVGLEMRARYPGRVAVYGPVWPLDPDAVEQVDRLVEEVGVVGIKLYPADVVEGEVKSFRMDDADLVFPILERARALGVRSVAIHKAVPLDRAPLGPYRVDDLDEACIAFPDLTIEIVHGGFAFLEDTAMLLRRFDNVVVNLEATSGYLPNHRRKFVDILGTLLEARGEDRIIWGTGCMAQHPQPLLERFWDLEFPPELVEGYGWPELTRERKAKILGGNAARILGLDVDALRAQSAGDPFDGRDGLAPPWSAPELQAAR